MALFKKFFKPKEAVDTSGIVDQIDYKAGTKFATNGANNVYVDIEELGGFPYLKTVIFGNINERVKKVGCTITFVFKNDELTLTSDNTQIESVNIPKSPIYYTEADFELEEREAKRIKSEKVLELKYDFKGRTHVFQPLK